MQSTFNDTVISQVWGRLNNAIIVRGEGSYIFDDQGNRFLDFTSGIGVTATGHCHPQVVAAVQSQASQLLFGQMNCMLPEISLRYAQALDAATPASIESFFFSNSGAEAVEGAIKLAKAATGRSNVIAFEGGFHGRTSMAMALTTSKKTYRAGYQPLPSGVFI
ncbi:MAG: aminotransferase class III-fold pyridoxal phosphate-dependent enzyme, partial [Planctomycetaceae bacterium]|nr:aminotransferase class III-fold pyridoxal phosphate-dependent enzyme [Planctomycetaceae bacterium]